MAVEKKKEKLENELKDSKFKQDEEEEEEEGGVDDDDYQPTHPSEEWLVIQLFIFVFPHSSLCFS